MAELRLQALDADDLNVVSAHCQDAIVRTDEMTYLPREQRFVLVCNRFDWVAARRRRWWFMPPTYTRWRAGLRLDGVSQVRYQGFDPRARGATAQTLTLLAITYTPDAATSPSGVITLAFGGGAALQLDVAAIEVELRDLGAVWSTEHVPDHDAAVAEQPVSTSAEPNSRPKAGS